MADTVNTQIVYNGNRRFTTHLTNESDGTGEAAVTKIDVSTLTVADGSVATYLTIDFIEYSVSGFNYVTLEFDNSGTNDELAVLKGQSVMDWAAFGGLSDPQTTNFTGDIVLTTDGGSDGASYDITIHARPKN